MRFWQLDLYRRPLRDAANAPIWELVIVAEGEQSFQFQALCPQSQVNTAWLQAQLERAIAHDGKPDRIQAFRPQTLGILQSACADLNIAVEATRRTPILKQRLQSIDYASQPNYSGEAYDPVMLERPAPLPLPDHLWGDRWRFGAIAAQDLLPTFKNRPIPITDIPAFLDPVAQGLASDTLIPGVMIQGGRQSMPLAKWLQRSHPFALTYIPGEPDGLILEAGLVERWILATCEDDEMRQLGREFGDRQRAAKGLHFLLVQPDDSGMTQTGFWLMGQKIT
jgi:RNA-binding protein Tab2/Atab2